MNDDLKEICRMLLDPAEDAVHRVIYGRITPYNDVIDRIEQNGGKRQDFERGLPKLVDTTNPTTQTEKVLRGIEFNFDPGYIHVVGELFVRELAEYKVRGAYRPGQFKHGPINVVISAPVRS